MSVGIERAKCNINMGGEGWRQHGLRHLHESERDLNCVMWMGAHCCKVVSLR